VEESYPAAAAIQLLHGKSLYQDVWFDKPPLSAYTYLLWGAQIGIPLRLAGAIFVLACCLMVYAFARHLWSGREGIAAAALLAFFLTFGIPAAVMALAPDLLMILPHIAAVYLACRGRPFWSGLMAGFALLVNSKAIFVLLACALWTGRAWPLLVLGFALPNVAAFAWFGRPYFVEVWKWGELYSERGFAWQTGFVRTWNWIGFQSALVAAAAWLICREKRLRMVGWLLISLIAVAAGWRFFPRYYFQLLPPLVLMAARGYTLMKSARFAVLALLLIPFVRFGPRYVMLANDLLHGRQSDWSDIRMNQDSREASALLDHDGTLLVWGYRPDIFEYTRLPAGTRFLDSQPLTGVLADRHLTNSDVAAPVLATQNRQEITLTRPTWIVDGLGPFNPRLAITNYPDLRDWLRNYREVGRTTYSVVYQLDKAGALSHSLPGPAGHALLQER
jgi:hypothetical protein